MLIHFSRRYGLSKINERYSLNHTTTNIEKNPEVKEIPTIKVSTITQFYWHV